MHQDAIAEMTEQIEQLNKMKNKVEKDKTLIMREIADARAAVDEVNRSKAASEKSHRNLLSTLNDQSKKIEEATLTLNDMEGAKRKIAAENADLLRQLQEMENSANMLSKLKSPSPTSWTRPGLLLITRPRRGSPFSASSGTPARGCRHAGPLPGGDQRQGEPCSFPEQGPWRG